MPLASGLAGQIGIATETTYGVPVAVTRFLPFVDESIVGERERLESEGIIAGERVLLSQSWNGGNITAGGDVGLELYDRSLGLLFTHMFGGVSTTGAGPYTHTFTPGDLSGKSFTAQVGRPTVNGTVIPFTYPGCKIGSWELACSAGEIATLGVTVIGRNEIGGVRTVTDGATTNASTTFTSVTGAFGDGDKGKPISATGIPAGTTIFSITSATSVVLSAAATATATGLTTTIGTALATASYSTGIKPLKFNHGAITIGGTAVRVTDATITGDNALKDDRRYIGDQLIGEPLEQGLREYAGSLTFEFEDITQYTRFVNGTEVALSLGFTAGTNSVTISGNIRYDGAPPTVGGRDILMQEVPIKFIKPVAAQAITAVLVNSDTTP